MIIAFFILLFLVFAIDFIPEFDVWQSRIHIGRWENNETWKKKIADKSLQWLKNTPTVKLTDNSRLIVIDMLKGNYKRNAIQDWQQAALLLGLVQAFEKTGDANIQKQVNAFIDSKIDPSGNWKQMPKEVDGVILAYAIMKANWIDHHRNKPAYDTIWNLLQNAIGQDGTVEYRKHLKDFRFVDTIGFICPFLICYGKLFNNNDAIELGCKHISEFNKNGMYENWFIPCHTYNIHSRIPVGLFGWGRGLGWYAIGLIDSWDELPESHPQKKDLMENVVSFATMALQFQNSKGGWNWLVTDSSAITDSSATATLAWFLSNASKIQEIKGDCLKGREKALQYLAKVTRRSGAIDLSQGDTKGIGIYSQKFDILPFTQGFALRTIYEC